MVATTVVVSGIPPDISRSDLESGLLKFLNDEINDEFVIRSIPNHPRTGKRRIALDFEDGFDAMPAQHRLNGHKVMLKNGRECVLSARVTQDPDLLPVDITTALVPYRASNRVDNDNADDDEMKRLKQRILLAKEEKKLLEMKAKLKKAKKKYSKRSDSDSDSDSESARKSKKKKKKKKRKKRRHSSSSSDDERKHKKRSSESGSSSSNVEFRNQLKLLETFARHTSKRYKSPPSSRDSSRKRCRSPSPGPSRRGRVLPAPLAPPRLPRSPHSPSRRSSGSPYSRRSSSRSHHSPGPAHRRDRSRGDEYKWRESREDYMRSRPRVRELSESPVKSYSRHSEDTMYRASAHTPYLPRRKYSSSPRVTEFRSDEDLEQYKKTAHSSGEISNEDLSPTQGRIELIVNIKRKKPRNEDHIQIEEVRSERAIKQEPSEGVGPDDDKELGEVCSDENDSKIVYNEMPAPFVVIKGISEWVPVVKESPDLILGITTKKRERRIASNPRFVIAVNSIIRKMRKHYRDLEIDSKIKEKLEAVLRKIMRLRIKDLLDGCSVYIFSRQQVNMYRDVYLPDNDEDLVKNVLSDIQDGRLDDFVPSDEEEEKKRNGIVSEDPQKLLHYVSGKKKKNTENKENEGVPNIKKENGLDDDIIVVETKNEAISVDSDGEGAGSITSTKTVKLERTEINNMIEDTADMLREPLLKQEPKYSSDGIIDLSDDQPEPIADTVNILIKVEDVKPEVAKVAIKKEIGANPSQNNTGSNIQPATLSEKPIKGEPSEVQNKHSALDIPTDIMNELDSFLKETEQIPEIKTETVQKAPAIKKEVTRNEEQPPQIETEGEKIDQRASKVEEKVPERQAPELKEEPVKDHEESVDTIKDFVELITVVHSVD